LRWIARQTSAGDWGVVRLRGAGLPQKVEVLGSAEQSPARPQAPDPRPLTIPYWGAG
jgi:hypothetical protein